MTIPPKSELDFAAGPVYQGGQRPVKTGNWRVFRPEMNNSRCNMCLLCWIYCPDGAVRRGETQLFIDYDYCKGCGICALECGAKAINMVRE